MLSARGGDNDAAEGETTLLRRSTRTRQPPRKLTFDERKGATAENTSSMRDETSSDESTNEGSDMDEESTGPFVKVPLVPATGAASFRPKGRLANDPSLSSGNVLFEHFSSGGTALKLVLDEWTSLFEENPENAALQLLNLTLWCSDIKTDLTRNDLEHSDPAAVLADLQDSWTTNKTPSAVLFDYPLSTKQRTKQSKALRRNFCEFWRKWSQSVLVSEREIETVTRLVLSWLMTMTSSGYRPLRHCASLACYEVALGACNLCQLATRELDQANKMAFGAKKEKSKLGATSAALIENVSTQLAALERIIQIFFDGVFVQRVRDVEPIIRGESLKHLAQWILAYKQVFLDNSYLRYFGWSLSDRYGSVRAAALEALETLYEDPLNWNPMEEFTARFINRMSDMAGWDVESAVRSRACSLLGFMYSKKLCQSTHLGFTVEKLKCCQLLSKEETKVIGSLIMEGLGSESAIEVTSLCTFLSQILLDEVAEDRQILVVEHFVCTMKNSLPILKDLPSLLLESSATDASRCLLIEACARYAIVYVNDTTCSGDLSRQIMNGINRFHSKDLAPFAVDAIKTVCNMKKLDNIAISAVFDLVALCDASALQEVGGEEHLSNVVQLAGRMTSMVAAIAFKRLLQYWESTIPNVVPHLVSTLSEGLPNLSSFIVKDWKKMKIGKLIQDNPLPLMFAMMDFSPIQDLALPAQITLLFELCSSVVEFSTTDQSSKINADDLNFVVRNVVKPLGLILSHPSMITSDMAMTDFIAALALSDSFRGPLGAAVTKATVVLELFTEACTSQSNSFTMSLPESALNIILDFIDLGLKSGEDADNGPNHAAALSAISCLGRLVAVGRITNIPKLVTRLFTWFPAHCDNAMLRFYEMLWSNFCTKYNTYVVDTIESILVSCFTALLDGEFYSEANERTLLSSMTMLVNKILLKSLREHPELRDTEKIVELHVRSLEEILEAVSSVSSNDPAKEDIILTGDYLDQVVAPFTTLLSPNLASEMLLTVKKSLKKCTELKLSCPVLLKSLEKAAAKKSTPKRPIAATANAKVVAISRLREAAAVTSTASDASEADGGSGKVVESETRAPLSDVENFMKPSEAGPSAAVSPQSTPTKAMAQLQMDEESGITPHSPIMQRRKRIIKY